ncbi:MAG: LacI family DNA-binding transcriptional regulator [Clostridia bacterium]|nr:LacI family DNA-binding transcriptional regulator [Clostridia bacterium]
MAVTIRDVSEKCGLSISTVSKALNHYSDISEETRKRVLETAKEIGYHPNALARALKTNRSYNLGVLFADEFGSGLTHPFFSAVLDSFKRTAEQKGYDITFINHNINQRSMTFLEHCHYRNVDGVCVACIDFYSPEIVQLMQSDLPAVTIDHSFDNRSCVLSDNVSGMELLVYRAAQLGHTRIAYVHGKKSAVTKSRLTGYHRAMAANGIPVRNDYLEESDYQDAHKCYAVVQKLLKLPQPPTCIFVTDDLAAIGGLDAIRDSGLRIGEDISIAGYDGHYLSQLMRPVLTTVKQNTAMMGQRAAEMLIRSAEEPLTAGVQNITVMGELIKGDTLRQVNPNRM